jgi:hypothetical protein
MIRKKFNFFSIDQLKRKRLIIFSLFLHIFSLFSLIQRSNAYVESVFSTMKHLFNHKRNRMSAVLIVL